MSQRLFINNVCGLFSFGSCAVKVDWSTRGNNNRPLSTQPTTAPVMSFHCAPTPGAPPADHTDAHKYTLGDFRPTIFDVCQRPSKEGRASTLQIGIDRTDRH